MGSRSGGETGKKNPFRLTRQSSVMVNSVTLDKTLKEHQDRKRASKHGPGRMVEGSHTQAPMDKEGVHAQ